MGQELDGAPFSRHSQRVLILAAACNPYKGSDFGVGWHRVLEAAKHFDTWAICGAWDRQDITHWLQSHGDIPHLHFCFVEDTRFDRLLKQRQPYFYTNFLSYHLWHRRAFILATRLHLQEQFALTHQVSLVGYREPGYLWKLDAPFIWGPVGGTQNYPWRFLVQAGFRGALVEGVRTCINWCQFRFSPRVRLAVKKAACLLAANPEIGRKFLDVHRVKAEILLDIGLDAVTDRKDFSQKPHTPLRLLWSGDLKHHKALPLLLRALALLPPQISYELRILGAGPQARSWQRLALQLGVADRCTWIGRLPHAQALQQYDWADIFVFTSLRETTGTVVLEALRQGVPVICLDHQGVQHVVTGACGIKIPVIAPEEAIKGFRDALLHLATDGKKIRKLSKGAVARAKEFLWSRNGQEMAKIYRSVLSGRRRPAARVAEQPEDGRVGEGKDVEITVVVVSYNRAALLRRALETLIVQRTEGKFSYEVLVIDDGSTDDTAAVVHAIARQAKPLAVRYVHQEGGGEGDARNRGAAEAFGRWVAFCDDDQLADPQWLSELYQAALEKDAQCVGGSVTLLTSEAGHLKLGPRARRFLGEKWLPAQLASPEAKHWLGAGNLLVHRSVFGKVGGFDPSYRQGVDTDFFWRVERAGFTLSAAPKALVYHVMTPSRLQPEYLRRVCLRKGIATHRICLKYENPMRVAWSMAVRLGIAIAVDLPLLAMAAVCHDSVLAIDTRCRLWYKIGFIRAGLCAAAPGMFRQAGFFHDVGLGYHGADR